jgi:RNA polymerase sigma-70 factor (ECF subfamily)
MNAEESKAGIINRLLVEFSKRAFNIAYRFTGNYNDAQDLAQEAFVRVILAVRDGRYDPERPPESYLFSIIRNIYIDGLRKKKKMQTVSLDELISGEETKREEFVKSTAPGQEETLERQALQNAVQSALASVPAKFRMPLILFEVEGFSYEEIAKIISSPAGTVRSRIHRGRKILAGILKEEEIMK